MTAFSCQRIATGLPKWWRAVSLCASAFFLLNVVHAVDAVDVLPPGKAFSLPLQKDDLDPSGFTEWEHGEAKALEKPEEIVWTNNSAPDYKSLTYGVSNRLGPRHLRIGFTKNISVGTVIVNGGGRLSVLKPGAAYPGRLDQASDWLPAQRLVEGKASTAEVEFSNLAAWVLPPHTTTRALRFTHEPQLTDRFYGETIGALYVLEDRLLNVAPLALAQARSNNLNAWKINDGKNNSWQGWANMDQTKTLQGVPLITPDDPEWIILSWKKPVPLRGLMSFFTGFGSGDIQVYAGPDSLPPRDAREDAWKTLHAYQGIKNGWPTLWPSWLPFSSDITTRAVRLRMMSVTTADNPNLQGKMNQGRRVWVDELMALTPLANQPLADQLATLVPPRADADNQLHPPIPIKFTLAEPGYVTLVIEKPDGFRVRNLISETFFPQGDNVAWWDGTDDLGRDAVAARHGLYHIPANPVDPGSYRVRGLTRQAITPRLEFSVYTGGDPAWMTADTTGAWLSNHSAPQAAAFVPGTRHPSGEDRIYLGSYTSEGRASLAWVNLEGRKKGGRSWVGGTWRGAPFLTSDTGRQVVEGDVVYTGSVGDMGKGPTRMELRLIALTTTNKERTVFSWAFDIDDPKKSSEELAGLAVFDGRLVASLPKQEKLLLVDAFADKAVGSAPFKDSRGLAFDRQGRLYVATATSVVRFARADDPQKMSAPEVLISSGLEDAQQLTVAADGKLYVSDWGTSHQVKVFAADPASANGYALVRVLGHPGAPKAGPYNPLHMNHPYGLALDSKDRLWVAEKDFLPKRVSLWSADGALENAFYGPAKYGGGGAISSIDNNVFYYGEEWHGTMVFELDWERGTSSLKRVLYRPGPGDLELPFRNAGPEVAYALNGKRYLTNSYNSSPIMGHRSGILFIERDGVAYPVAGMGRAGDWEAIKGKAFHHLWPAGVDPTHSRDHSHNNAETYFVWSDLNGDAQVQPDEVVIQLGTVGGITVMPDLSFQIASVDNERAVRYAPTGFTPAGAPLYDARHPEVLARDLRNATTSGGYQVLHDPEGWTVLTLGVAPFDGRSITGVRDQQARWSYPNLWPGQAEGNEAPTADRPGELIGTTRLLGGFFEVPGSDAGPLWALNGNMGNFYIFTADGLFVATLFHDKRLASPLAMPNPVRGMDLSAVTLEEENFWPTISRTSDGNVFIIDGNNSTIIRLDGLETVRRLPDQMITVTAKNISAGQEYKLQLEALRQQEQGRGILPVVMLAQKPVIDGDLGDWPLSTWVDIDKTGVRAHFSSPSRPFDITGALAVSGDRLYAAYRTHLPKLLQNSGAMPVAPFKTGGALDLMIGANPKADPDRKEPVNGDVRLLVTLVEGEPRAMLYLPVLPSAPESARVPFSSPWRTITFDRVEDVSSEVQFAAKDGDFELSIPLKLLRLQPQAGLQIKGDIGVLRGDNNQTTARVYWSNKGANITSDVPSEAALTPSLWGILEFQPEPSVK